MPRFFVPAAQVQGATAVIGGRDADHLARSLRMRPGETVVVVEEGRREHGVVLESVSPQEVGGRIVWSRDVTGEPAPEATTGVRFDAGRPVAVVIGPEGGLDERDRDVLRAAHATDVHLGSRVMPARLAGFLAVSLLLASAGDLDVAVAPPPRP